MAAIHATITGRVQGVGYRAWTEGEARHRGLAGWVRNRRDGSVEAVFSGEEAVVEEMVTALWTGPGGSDVTGVETRLAGEDEVEAGPEFELRPTA